MSATPVPGERPAPDDARDAVSEQPALFRPITIRGLTIRNRVWVPPLCQYSVTERDGVPHDWHLVHLGAMAAGGAGLVVAEATAVSPEGRISDHDTGLWNDEHEAACQRGDRAVPPVGAPPGDAQDHEHRQDDEPQEHEVVLAGEDPQERGADGRILPVGRQG